MLDKVVKSADMGPVNFPFPGYTGDIKIKLLNTDYALGPSIIHIRMEPGAFHSGALAQESDRGALHEVVPGLVD